MKPRCKSPTIARARRFLTCLVLIGLAGFQAPPARATQATELETALSLANLLRAGRTVISINQDLINDPHLADKGLDGNTVVRRAVEIYRENTGVDPLSIDETSRQGRLLRAQMEAIRQVLKENQKTINRKGIGFKGFVPAVFGRLVNERFGAIMGEEAEVKVTAPLQLVRNRKSRPDIWEAEQMKTKLMKPDWPDAELISAVTTDRGREAFRVLVPEYYGAGCLACHGGPKGEIDVTGYPKEGGKLGELGGVISITLFR